MKGSVVLVAYQDDGCNTLTLKNAKRLEDMLSEGWNVVRVDVMPGLGGKGKYEVDGNVCFEPSLSPTLVYILAKDDSAPAAPSDSDFMENIERMKRRLEEDVELLKPLRELHGDHGHIRAAGSCLEGALWNIETILSDGDRDERVEGHGRMRRLRSGDLLPTAERQDGRKAGAGDLRHMPGHRTVRPVRRRTPTHQRLPLARSVGWSAPDRKEGIMTGRSQLDFELEYVRGESIPVSTDKTIAQIASDAYAKGFAAGRLKPQTEIELDAALRYLAGHGLLRKDITIMEARYAIANMCQAMKWGLTKRDDK